MPSARAGDFHFVMIKPSHHDDEGYPIQWIRSAIPSNTLAALNGLAEDAVKRQVLGAGVRIHLHSYDEPNRRVRPDRILRDIRRSGGRALIGLVGVQSNQYPRAVDLARIFRAAGLPVMIGGFHVSGTLARLPPGQPELVAAQEMGISLFAGEAEERRLDQVFQDAWDARSSRCTMTWTRCPPSRASHRPSWPRSTWSGPRARSPRSTSAAAAPASAASAPSSTCRAARAASAPPMTSKPSSARTTGRASSASSSPTTISRATGCGNRCSTG
jgi:hypothetical protein